MSIEFVVGLLGAASTVVAAVVGWLATQTRANSDEVQSALDAYKSLADDIQEDRDETRSQLESLQAQCDTLEQRCDQLADERDELEDLVDELRDEIDTLREELSRERGKRRQAQRQIDLLKSRIEGLHEFLADHSGVDMDELPEELRQSPDDSDGGMPQL